MKTSIDIIGGADGPTAIYVSYPIGREVLLCFAALLVVLGLLVCAARKFKKHTAFAPLGAALTVAADQWVKASVVRALALGETAPLLPGLFRLERVHNYGAAWSSFSGARWLLVGTTAAGIGALACFVIKRVRHPLGVWALWLVIGGGVGNLIDRVRLGYVVDMLAAEFVRFPVFNVADILITCGAIAAAVYYLKFHESADGKNGRVRSDGHHPSDNGT